MTYRPRSLECFVKLQGAYWMLDLNALDEQQPLRMKIKPKAVDRVSAVSIVTFTEPSFLFYYLLPS